MEAAPRHRIALMTAETPAVRRGVRVRAQTDQTAAASSFLNATRLGRTTTKFEEASAFVAQKENSRGGADGIAT